MANNNNNNRENKDYNDNKHLFYLHELSDYKVASDDPDVRGWDVKDSNNRVIGKVDNLLVNKDSNRVVYLDVEVDKSILDANHEPYGKPASGDVHEFVNKEGENHIIIPIGLVSINDDDNFVYTDRINHDTFASTKRIKKGANVNRDYEVVVLNSYDRNRETDRDRDFNQAGRTTEGAAAGTTSTNRVAGESPTGTSTDRNMGASDRTGTTATNRNENVAGLNRDKRDERSDVNRPAGDSPVGNRDVTDKTTSATNVQGNRQNDPNYRENQREESSAVGNAAERNYRSENAERERTGDEQLGTEGLQRGRTSETEMGSGERGRAADQDLREGAERRGRADENLRRGDDGTFYERTEFDDKNFRRRNNE